MTDEQIRNLARQAAQTLQGVQRYNRAMGVRDGDRDAVTVASASVLLGVLDARRGPASETPSHKE